MFIQTSTTAHELQKWEPAGRIGNFGNYFNGLAKSRHVLRSFWIYWMSVICIAKLWNTAFCPRSVWYLMVLFHLRCYVYKVWKAGLHVPRLVRFCKVLKLVERTKFGLVCFPGLMYCDQELLWLLNVIEDDCTLFFGCTYQAIKSM